jgi:hypothetical protein
MKVKKSAMKPFYIEKDYKGEDNEKDLLSSLKNIKI